MNEADMRKTIERYNSRLQEFGATEKALGWGDKGRSKLRFKILTSQWNFENASVLDFGCGFGDLYSYLNTEKNSKIDYLGIDINPNLIAVAEKRYPEAKFLIRDILSQPLNTKFDYVLASGTFNAKLEDNIQFIGACLNAVAKIAQKGFAINFLSDKVDYQSDITYHANPGQIIELFYAQTKNVVLRNDYMPYEFTVFADLAARVDQGLTVYEDYVKDV